MNIRTALLLGAACFAPLAASAQSSSTPIIGFYKVDVPAGTSTWTCGFVTKTEFQGAMLSATPGATKSTITGPAGAFSGATYDLHYVEILSGAQQGLILDIDPATPPTANTLTVLGNIGPSGFALTGTETFCIRRHATLGSVFKDGAGLNAFSDTITLFDSAGVEHVAAFDGSAWVDAADFVTDRNADIIYPGQGFLISSAGAEVTMGGDEVSYVKSGPLKVPVYGSVINLVGVVSPLVSTNPSDPGYAASQVQVDQLGLDGYLSPFSDIVTFFSGDGLLSDSSVYGFDGGSIVLASDFSTPGGSDTVRNGVGFAISAAGDGIYTQPQLVP